MSKFQKQFRTVWWGSDKSITGVSVSNFCYSFYMPMEIKNWIDSWQLLAVTHFLVIQINMGNLSVNMYYCSVEEF